MVFSKASLLKELLETRALDKGTYPSGPRSRACGQYYYKALLPEPLHLGMVVHGCRLEILNTCIIEFVLHRCSPMGQWNMYQRRKALLPPSRGALLPAAQHPHSSTPHPQAQEQLLVWGQAQGGMVSADALRHRAGSSTCEGQLSLLRYPRDKGGTEFNSQ